MDKTFTGHVKDAAIVLDEPVELPEGAKLTVVLHSEANEPENEKDIPTHYERYKDFIGILEGPPDLALNHDYYLHGLPKKDYTLPKKDE